MGSLQNVLYSKISPNVISKETASPMDRVVKHLILKWSNKDTAWVCMGLLSFSSTNTRQHTIYHVNTLLWGVWASQTLCKLIFFLKNCHMLNLFIFFSIAQNKQTCVWDLQFHPAASTPYLDKDSWRLYSLPKSMLFDFRVLTKSNWLASENCFVRFSDILWRPNPSRWKARTGSTSGLKELGEEKEKHKSTY